MLGQHDAIATVAVKNLETAKKFYEGTLGLEVIGAEGHEVVMYRTGNSRLNVYRSKYAGTNQATEVTWAVPDVDSEVQELRRAGSPSSTMSCRD